jgi:hypothetical protein
MSANGNFLDVRAETKMVQRASMARLATAMLSCLEA